jgi:hypothetical protein
MKDLKILKSKSKQAAIQFGGLYHKFLWGGEKNDSYLVACSPKTGPALVRV